MQLLEKIRELDLQDEVSESVYKRGVDYYKRRLVRLNSSSEDKLSLNVMGSELYHVDFSLKRNRFSYGCNCPSYFNWGTCKHIVASDLFVKNSNPAIFIPTSVETDLDIDQVIANGRHQFLLRMRLS